MFEKSYPVRRAVPVIHTVCYTYGEYITCIYNMYLYLYDVSHHDDNADPNSINLNLRTGEGLV